MSRSYKMVLGDEAGMGEMEREVTALLGRGWAPLGPPVVLRSGTVAQALVDQAHAPVNADDLYHAVQDIVARMAQG